ncbi:MAG: hypothetical protein HY360_20755 [Verrucomicrobia bacterium]|nr:hypothetical protein [Verrucomicrobiota bacterium]
MKNEKGRVQGSGFRVQSSELRIQNSELSIQHFRSAFGILPCLCAIFLLAASMARAEVKPHALFSEGAVLQQQMNVPVWGAAADGEQVTVEFQDQKVAATTTNGQWLARLQPLKAGGPFTMKISGANTLTFTNILVGEVWVCSGQSNMVYPLQGCEGGPEAMAASKDPLLRLLVMPSCSRARPCLRRPWSPSLTWAATRRTPTRATRRRSARDWRSPRAPWLMVKKSNTPDRSTMR